MRIKRENKGTKKSHEFIVYIRIVLTQIIFFLACLNKEAIQMNVYEIDIF